MSNRTQQRKIERLSFWVSELLDRKEIGEIAGFRFDFDTQKGEYYVYNHNTIPYGYISDIIWNRGLLSFDSLYTSIKNEYDKRNE